MSNKTTKQNGWPDLRCTENREPRTNHPDTVQLGKIPPPHTHTQKRQKKEKEDEEEEKKGKTVLALN